MLLIRELWRVVGNVVSYSFTSGRILILLALVGALVALVLSASVTVIGPVAVYPFL